MTKFYWLVLAALGVWRITHLLAEEDGPFKLVARLRKFADRPLFKGTEQASSTRQLAAGFWGELLDCFYCLSLWVAAPFAYFLGAGWAERLVLWPALSAAAILLERATAPDVPAVPEYTEDPVEHSMEVTHELLRKDKTASFTKQ
jgi:uncharacterized protein DUF1360